MSEVYKIFFILRLSKVPSDLQKKPGDPSTTKIEQSGNSLSQKRIGNANEVLWSYFLGSMIRKKTRA